MKEQYKSPEEELSEEEIGSLLEKDFKAMMVKIKNLREMKSWCTEQQKQIQTNGAILKFKSLYTAKENINKKAAY